MARPRKNVVFYIVKNGTEIVNSTGDRAEIAPLVGELDIAESDRLTVIEGVASMISIDRTPRVVIGESKPARKQRKPRAIANVDPVLASPEKPKRKGRGAAKVAPNGKLISGEAP
jgi:hypothetical protein